MHLKINATHKNKKILNKIYYIDKLSNHNLKRYCKNNINIKLLLNYIYEILNTTFFYNIFDKESLNSLISR